MADERAVDDLIETRCEECGTVLAPAEIEDALQAGRPFLCSVHAAEHTAVDLDAEPPEPA